MWDIRQIYITDLINHAKTYTIKHYIAWRQKRELTLNVVSGRLQIPRSREELTVAAVGGNLYKCNKNPIK